MLDLIQKLGSMAGLAGLCLCAASVFLSVWAGKTEVPNTGLIVSAAWMIASAGIFLLIGAVVVVSEIPALKRQMANKASATE